MHKLLFVRKPMINHHTISTTPTMSSNEQLSVEQLTIVADVLCDEICRYRPEFANLVNLHRHSGCRVKELFQPTRWKVESTASVLVYPQKRNAVRNLRFVDIGVHDAAAFGPILADMARLPLRQYERAFSAAVRGVGLYRLYDNGFATPSTHMFRHVKIKELSAQGWDKERIATWIGEKNTQNLDYYLNSQYFQ